MAQLRAKQIKLTGKNDLLIGGDVNGNGAVLSVGSEKQVLKVVNGGLAYAMQAATDVTFADASFTATDVSAALVEAKALATTANTAAGAAQTELDATQVGAGLGTGGAYTADNTTNYITTATSLANADKLLDAQLKTVTDEIANLGSGSLTGLQAELDATEASVGLNTDGTLVPFQTGGAVAGKTTFLAAVNALDTALTAETSAREAAIAQEVTDRDTAIATALTTAEGYADANLTTAEGYTDDQVNQEKTRAEGIEAGLQTELDALEVTVGSNTDGTAKAYSSGNYIVKGDGNNAPDDHTVAIGKLDDALKTTADGLANETTARIGGDNAIIQGAGLAASGAYAPHTGANYIAGATTLDGADVALDSALKTLQNQVDSLGSGSITSLQAEVDQVEASSGLAADGTLTAFAAVTGNGSTHLTNATTLKAAIEALDSGLADDDAAIAQLQSQVSALAGLGALHFVGTVDGNETDTSTVTPTPETGSVYRVTTDGNSNWAGTGLEVNAGDYVVKTADGWVKFDNTDPVVSSTDNNIDVEGGTHQGFTIALKNKANFTSTSDAIVVTGGTASLLTAASVALDPSKINFSALGQVGTPADGKYLKWDNTAQALTYVSAGQIGVTVQIDQDFVPGTGGVVAGANASVTLTSAAVGDIAVYMNGLKLKKAGYTIDSGKTTVTLVDANNGYALETGDTLTVAYESYVA